MFGESSLIIFLMQVLQGYSSLLFFSFELKVSAMVAGEFYAKGHFPGFGRPFVCNAEVLFKFVKSILLTI